MSLAGEGQQKLSKEGWRKQKELEEARKAGTAPAEVDESGRDINPHIPQYIKSAPWYVSTGQPTLKHQRPQPEKQQQFDGILDWYMRGVDTSKKSSKFRKGACENCGAITHKKRDCMDRPRKVGAIFSGDNIACDEYEQPELSLDYDGKRDRWNGFNPNDYDKVMEEHVLVEKAKQQIKAETLETELTSHQESTENEVKIEEAEGSDNGVTVINNTDPTDNGVKKEAVGSDRGRDSDNEEMCSEIVGVPGQKFDSKLRTTVRNLRIREDTAKYLLNLNLNSAFYDPKSRSMRDNPYSNTGKVPSEVPFAGENFVRSSGETSDMAKAQLFTWEAFERGVELHLQGEPTKAELLYKEVNQRKDAFNNEIKQEILDKYGGEEYLKVPPKELIFSQNERYIEYSRTGRVVKGEERAPVKSKYEEDKLDSNHTAVWGSYWKEGKWGYSCCHSLIKLSYCTGLAGQQAEREAEKYLAEAMEKTDDSVSKSLVELHKERMVEKRKNKNKVTQEELDKIREEKVQEAIKEIQQEINKESDNNSATDRKRVYSSMQADPIAPSEEQLEAYHRVKKMKNDPMSDFIGKDY
ncbi:Pre-mRNA-splicing factor SLU7-like [Oopsacas minuta]|uniref:Pre-mRNA-splicing factor SLU7 n=1 Tax=Oopsacas minuta TaxID=111878 RepID=A0AAV7KEZ4_9METZ|nr:Pre-mRNA-splicing factor SLU7-like [Oopsacas minuta]